MDLGSVQGKSAIRDPLFTEFGEQVFAIDDPSLLVYNISWLSESRRKADATVKDFCSEY